MSVCVCYNDENYDILVNILLLLYCMHVQVPARRKLEECTTLSFTHSLKNIHSHTHTHTSMYKHKTNTNRERGRERERKREREQRNEHYHYSNDD